MNQDEITNTEFDTELTRLFAEKNEPLADRQFTQQLLVRLNREYRMRQIRSGIAVAFVLVLAAVVAPWVVKLTAELLSLSSDVSKLPGVNKIATFGMLLVSGVIFFRARRRI